jgi:hypothetical protein
MEILFCIFLQIHYLIFLHYTRLGSHTTFVIVIKLFTRLLYRLLDYLRRYSDWGTNPTTRVSNSSKSKGVLSYPERPNSPWSPPHTPLLQGYTQWITCSFLAVKRSGCEVNHSRHQALRLRMSDLLFPSTPSWNGEQKIWPVCLFYTVYCSRDYVVHAVPFSTFMWNTSSSLIKQC